MTFLSEFCFFFPRTLSFKSGFWVFSQNSLSSKFFFLQISDFFLRILLLAQNTESFFRILILISEFFFLRILTFFVTILFLHNSDFYFRILNLKSCQNSDLTLRFMTFFLRILFPLNSDFNLRILFPQNFDFFLRVLTFFSEFSFFFPESWLKSQNFEVILRILESKKKKYVPTFFPGGPNLLPYITTTTMKIKTCSIILHTFPVTSTCSLIYHTKHHDFSVILVYIRHFFFFFAHSCKLAVKQFFLIF